jgi:NNP family nitrate/nitrite transporter-like MFS transporter
MIPAIFRAKCTDAREARRLSGALIGIAGAVGAFGGVLVNVAFRQSFLETKEGNAAYVAFLAYYVICLLITYVVYLRPRAARLIGV